MKIFAESRFSKSHLRSDTVVACNIYSNICSMFLTHSRLTTLHILISNLRSRHVSRLDFRDNSFTWNLVLSCFMNFFFIFKQLIEGECFDLWICQLMTYLIFSSCFRSINRCFICTWIDKILFRANITYLFVFVLRSISAVLEKNTLSSNIA